MGGAKFSVNYPVFFLDVFTRCYLIKMKRRFTTICIALVFTLALWPMLGLFTGQYTIIRKVNSVRRSEISDLNLRVFSDDELSDEMKTEDSSNSLGLQVELQKVLSVNQSSPRAAFETVVALSSLLPRIKEVPRIKTPTPETFRSYIAPVGLPVVFTDMLVGTRLADWSWDMLRARYGHQVFHNTRQGNYSTKKTSFGKQVIGRTSISLADFIDVATGKRKPKKGEEGLYITKQRIIPKEALDEEFFYPPFYPGSHKQCYLEPTAW